MIVFGIAANAKREESKYTNPQASRQFDDWLFTYLG